MLNVNRVYKAKVSKLSSVPLDQFDFWFGRALDKLKCDPVKDVVLIAKTMKVMFRDNLKRNHG
jgi:hypothetical protein